MFLRLHHIGESTYCEVLESYRDPATGKPRHRLVVRWAAQYGRDVRQQIPRAKLQLRRAKADLHQAEQDLADCHPDDAARFTRVRRELASRARRREAKATVFFDQLIKAEAGLARSGKVAERITTTKTKGPMPTEMEGSDGRRWRVRHFERRRRL